MHGRAQQIQFRIGLLHSLTGTMAISERPLLDAELLAIEEINLSGGILGHMIEPLVSDGASHPGIFADEAGKMLANGISTIFGCWTSASRKAVKPLLESEGGLLWYPVQYEGLEESTNIVYTGSCPNQQIIPATEWVLNNLGKRIFLVGSDYVFPRAANVLARSLVEENGGGIVGERYFPLDNKDFGSLVAEIRQIQPSAVFNTLNGESNLWFYRQFHAAGIRADNIPIVAVSAGETEMQSIAGLAAGHLACWSYFQSFDNPENLQFVSRFRERYGSSRVCSDPVAMAYSQIYLWQQAVETAGSFEATDVRRCLEGCEAIGPSGRITIEPNHHVAKRAVIGQLDTDGQFEVVWRSPKPIAPLPWLGAENIEPAGRSLIKQCMSSFSESLHYSTLLEQQLQERRRLELALQEANRQLDARVAERTAELNDAINKLEQEIVERQEAEANLRESRERLQVIFNSVNDAILVHDPVTGSIVDSNDRATELFGWSSEELLQKTVGDLSSRVPTYTLDEALKLIRKAAAGEPQIIEWQGMHRYGRLIWVEVSLRRAKIADQERVLAVLRDVTERHEAAESLKRSEERYRAVVDCIPAGIVLHSNYIIRYANPAAVRIGKLNSSDEMLGRTIWDFIDPSMHNIYRERYLRVMGGESDSERLDGRLIDSKGNMIYIEGAAIKISFDSETGILSTFTDVTERRKAEAALRESEERFKIIATSSPDHLLVQDRDLRYVFVLNPQLGWSVEDMIGRTDYDLASPEDAAMLEKVKRQVIDTGKSLKVSMPLVSSDGNVRYLDGSYVPKFDSEGNVDGLIGYFKDITDLKKTEEALKESENRFRGYFENQVVGMAITSPDKGWLNVNNKLCQMLGYSREELFHLSWDVMTFPDDLQTDIEKFDRVLAGEINGYALDKRFVRKDGSIIYTMLSIGCVRSEDGAVKYILALVEDVTDRRTAEERLQLAMEAATEGVYDWNVPTGEVYYSPGWYRSLGYEAADLKPDVSTWETLTHPEDLADLLDNLNAHLAGKTPVYIQEYRLRRKDGSYRWTIDRGKVVQRDSEGKPLRMVGTDIDITERKQAEEERRALERHKRVFYRQTILSVTDGKLEICDSDDIEPYLRNAQVVHKLERKQDMSLARAELEELCVEAGLDEKQTADFILAFGEAATNAIKHAQTGTVYAAKNETEIWVAVVDYGTGINSLVLPAAVLRRGFSTKPSMGFGYSIMLDISDHIMLKSDSTGTSVVLVKRTAPPEEPLLMLPDTWAGLVDRD